MRNPLQSIMWFLAKLATTTTTLDRTWQIFGIVPYTRRASFKFGWVLNVSH